MEEMDRRYCDSEVVTHRTEVQERVRAGVSSVKKCIIMHVEGGIW
jgi:hypothetical protein